MNSPIKINHRDFEYLTTSDQEYLLTIERLYLLNSGKLKHFHTLGPWHQVKSRQLNRIVERVAAPNPRPCSRGHVKGLWCVEDPDYISGPTILKYNPVSESETPGESGTSTPALNTSSESRTPKPPKTPKNKYSIPRKYQVIPKPSPWIIMEPSKKKNFICDDPPDPTYDRMQSASLPRSATTRQSTAKSRLTRPSTAGEDRYTMSPYATSISPSELEQIVERVTRPTHASKGGVDLREKYRNKDYVYGSRSCTPNIEHITKPTISSRGGKDIAEKFENKDYVYGSKSVEPKKLDDIVDRVTRPTVASSGGAGANRSYTDFVYGEQKVSKEEMKEIIERMTKPTISSNGAVDLKDKNFVYLQQPRNKTNIIIPGLEKKFIGRKKISSDELNEIIDRLTQLTPAYKAKFAVNPNVWQDESARTGPAHQRESIAT
ncbi:hypothetical protein MAR_033803 [Mya arenaria]|uniref:Uncharacterized protein n=1 Tax=Mya arenaria TaxID=6604 RepID=A0ABY7GE79_MYAAR|nr:uncharacterized protein LOC128222965 [Mya arenaria]XP_052788118.1 uncharacterized protein LOC128222965 [Mya arenaria]XP_052788120.1 uncharacterized protein LOC128222965 [Mya arenaria]WAR31261.1 hypothetical protein MAR_033803 [Mya arenaria]